MNSASFHAEARWQGECANCGSRDSAWHAHHVVSRRELERRGEPLWDTRNALRLCSVGCHLQHEWGPRTGKLALAKLTDENVEYAFEILGPYAYDYLRRHYAGEDARVTLELAGA